MARKIKYRCRKVFSAILATSTMMTPIAAYAAEAVTPSTELVSKESPGQIEDVVTEANLTEYKRLDVDVGTGGYIILNEGFDSQRTIKNEEKENGKEFYVYDKDGVLMETTGDYGYDTKADDVVIIKAVADDGYDVSRFIVDNEDTGFDNLTEAANEFSYTAFMDEDKVLCVSFEKETKDTEASEEMAIPNASEKDKNADAETDKKDDGQKESDITVSEQDEKQLDKKPEKQDEQDLTVSLANNSKTQDEADLTVAEPNSDGKPSDEVGETSDDSIESEDKADETDEKDIEPDEKTSESDRADGTSKSDRSLQDIDEGSGSQKLQEAQSDTGEELTDEAIDDAMDDAAVMSLEDESRAVDSSDINACYIKAYEISNIVDGTAPFDADDASGNDSSSENGIVRSFDSVNYTLKYTTAIRDSELQGIDSANVMAEFVLPCSPIKAEFNVETMTWMLDKKIVYTYDDGSSSTTYDISKNVVSQKLTGRRLLVNNEAGNSVPGTGTLSIGVKVNAAVSGDVITPSFTIWMEGNGDNEKKTVNASTDVSAAPKYDIVVKRNGSANLLGYYNLKDKTVKVDAEKDTDKYGKLQIYAICLAIQNDSVQKGMKGVEYPDGSDITFDLRMSEILNGVDVSNQENYQPLLWDYAMDNGTKSSGKLGRPMSPFGQYIASTGQWTTNTPWNNGNYSGACYNGGDMNILQDTGDSNLLHVTLSGYQLDMKDFDFPVKYSGATYDSIPVNTGYFSVGLLQMIARFNTSVDVIENVGVNLAASNIHATSMSGIDVTEEVNLQNNINSVQVTNYPSGSHSKRNFYYSTTGGYMRPTTWDSGDSYAYVGEKVLVGGHMIYNGDKYLEANNILQKIDDKAFTIPVGTSKYTAYGRSNSLTEIGDIKTLFAAKPDKTGWLDDEEMNNTHEEQLVYFESIDDLTNAGYTCVGMLYEIRNSKLYPNNAGGCIEVRQLLNIRPDVKTGNVYMTKNDVRSWRDGTDFSYTNIVYDNTIKAYGIGNSNWPNGTYADGYTKPTYRYDLNYGKAVYKDGTMVSGHWNGYQGGNSLLIIGNKTRIGVEVADKTGNKPKSVYDLDAGERTARFTVQPATIITSANSEVQSSGAKDNLRIEVTLPKGLHFNKNGVSLEPESVNENSDGTTTIIWKMNDVKVGVGLDPITFSTIIGEEGTINDVHHNDSFTVIAKITSDNDTRKVMAANGNYSETEISVIKLAASAVTKRVLTPLVEIGDDIQYRLRYSNLSDTEALNSKLYDVLPYNNDGRGTKFGGMYALKSIVIDFSNAPKTFDKGKDSIRSYASIDNSTRDKTKIEDTLATGSNMDKFSDVTGAKTIDNDNKTITWDGISLDNPTAFIAYLGYVFGHEYIDVYVTITPRNSDTKQQPQDLYANNFIQYADNQASSVTSNVVKAQVVTRNLSGVAWLDSNGDGIRQDDEQKLSDMIVTLYRDTSSSGESRFNRNPQTGLTDPVILGPNGASLAPAHKISGEAITEIKTGADGSYKFDDVEPGTYCIKFTHDKKYRPTVKDAGDSDEVDSDIDVWNANNSYIATVELPGVANMTDWTYSSPNHDAGFIINTKLSVLKKAADTNKPLAGAELALYKASDVESGKPKDGAAAIETWTSTDQAKIIENKLTAGESYVLIETAAPKGYDVSDPITFTAQSDGATQEIIMTDNINSHEVVIRKIDMDDKLIGGAKLKVTGTESATKKQITPIEWTSEANVEKRLKLRPGSYILTETKAPAGYKLAENIKFTVDEQGITRINGKKYDTLNMLDREFRACKINITKHAADGKKVLPGVEFTLTFVKAKYPELASQDGYNRRLKVGESVTLATDENGKICFDNLDQGTYTLKESKSLPGYQPLAQEMTIELPMTMTYIEVKHDGNIDTSKADYFDNLYHFYELSYDITNNASFDIPRTGSNGFWMYGMLGIVMAAMTVVIFLKRRKYPNRRSKKNCQNSKK